MLAKLYHDNTSISSKTASQFVASIDYGKSAAPHPFGYPCQPAIPFEKASCRMRLDKVTSQRCSQREFVEQQVSQKNVSALFHTALGVGGLKDDGLAQRPYPSAGALYPVNCFLLSRNIEGMGMGIYHVNGDRKVFEVINDRWEKDDFDNRLQSGIIAETPIHNASFFVLLTGDVEKACGKYGDRGYRFMLLEAGHIAQNLSLAAVACRIDHVALGGFCEKRLEQLVGVFDFGHKALYVLAFGIADKTNRF